MRKLTLSNYLFLIPALIVGPFLLLALIAHGLALDLWARGERRLSSYQNNQVGHLFLKSARADRRLENVASRRQ
ncbi:hypothetical protein [Hyphomicrobium sp.]|uniref:hypothetical protein n=1 Tax=Hyphomicrobium sp. TaxID=82 RepID=UPI000F924E3F|nr:hypothetical protein [Hyphomicrobium sp.]RUO98264.1 MAG: hypothetical protein EKK30_12365 [Hyphomicrobium sp.]